MSPAMSWWPAPQYSLQTSKNLPRVLNVCETVETQPGVTIVFTPVSGTLKPCSTSELVT